MTNINILWVIFLIIYILVFLGLAVFRFINDKNAKDDNFSFLRNFPSEMIAYHPSSEKIYRIILYVFAGFCFSPVLVVVPLIKEFGDLAWIAIFAGCVFGLEGIVFAGLHLFEPKYIKTHSLLATIFIVLGFFSSALTALYSFLSYNVYARFNEGSILSIICGVFAIIFALTELIIAVNPKLKDWIKLNKITNNDGSISYSRPKIVSLAFSEWLTALILFLSEIIFFISLIHV